MTITDDTYDDGTEPPYDPAHDEPDAYTPPPTRRGHLTAVPDTTPTPHHAPDLEETILGAALLSTDARDHLPAITPHLYSPNNRLLADTITTIHATGAQGDITLDVAEHLRTTGQLDQIGGTNHLLALQTAACPPGAVPRHAATIHGHSTRRQLGAIGHDITDLAHQTATDPAELTAQAQALLDRLHDTTSDQAPTLQPIADAIDDYIDELDARANRDLAGHPTGWPALDRALAGLQGGRLYVIAGRPGMGKSDVATILAHNLATQRLSTLVVSIEMATTELLDRWASHTSRLPVATITTGRIQERDATRFGDAIAGLTELPLWIDDNPTATIATTRTAVRRSKADVLIVDYLQLLGAPKGHSREAEVARLAGDLKRIARDHDIPVVALAQLNRAAETRIEKRPALADLRESGAIEQDADVVIGLYRDDYYHRDSKDKGVLEMVLLKNRSGPQTTVKLGYDPATKTIDPLPAYEGDHP